LAVKKAISAEGFLAYSVAMIIQSNKERLCRGLVFCTNFQEGMDLCEQLMIPSEIFANPKNLR